MRRVYLDHSATTPVDSRVVEAMLPYFTEKFGNASSVHQLGQEARGGVDRARRQIAKLLGAHENEIVFTSGGTEANNLAVRGVTEHANAAPGHVIISAIEHPSIRASAEQLQKAGWKLTILPVYEEGIVRVEDVQAALKAETILVSIMTANNEIGTIQPIAEIGSLIRAERERGRRIWFHTDAVQAAGRLPLNVNSLGCDLLSLSAHKIYAPKGTGALFVRKGVRLFPQQHGGHQERERRGGTEAVPNIVAFGAAAQLAQNEMQQRNEHVRRLRDRFEQKLSARVADFVFNGDRAHRLPHLSNLSFSFIEGEGLLIHLDMRGIAVSTGSACSSGTIEPSPVIRALGRDDELARGSLRFSFGKDNTDEDVDYAVDVTARAVESLRELSPLGKIEISAVGADSL